MQDTSHTSQGNDPATVKTVLVVEDDADIAEALMAILRDATLYEVIHVSDGFAALKVVRTLIPQLILLDYRLPGMDGLECLDRLRESKGMEQTPVILMSAGLPEGIQKRGHVQARSDLIFLEKPFDMNTLLDLVKQQLES